MLEVQKVLNAIIILIICGVLLGAFGVQLFGHETPCPLCMLQRLGMIGVAASLCLNLQFGVRPLYYGLALLCSVIGGFVALRQISLHVCPGFSTFGIPVLGLSLYTWSFLVFVCCVLAIALLLMIYEPTTNESTLVERNYLNNVVWGILFFVCFANVITTFLQCGLGACT